MEPSERNFLEAAKNGDAAEVKELIKRGVRKDILDPVRFYLCLLWWDNIL